MNLSIGELAEATGVTPGTLRMWESRFGFPVAGRGDGGHRRYSQEDVARVARVVAERERGLSLPAAIDRARDWQPAAPPSLFNAIRAREPNLPAQLLPLRAMLAVSHAIEDECMARAARPIVVGAFQTERAYRAQEPRWRELTRSASVSFVLGDFAQRHDPDSGPAEVPLDPAAPAAREWAVICVDAHYAACLAGWEQPPRRSPRVFEAVWSTDPQTVLATLDAATGLVDQDLGARVTAGVAGTALPTAPDMAVANRMIGYLVRDLTKR